MLSNFVGMGWMESKLEKARLRERLAEATALRKKLTETNRQLQTEIRNLLDLQRQKIGTLLGTVTKGEIRFNAKQASSLEATLTSVSRTLIEAQEQERARIARELHDDISQRLALLAIGIEQLGQELIGAYPSEVDHRTRELKELAIGIGADLHNMAHELHSSSLEYLGFVSAVRKLAEGVAKRHSIQIEIKHDVPSRLPAEISLCLFRIAQEGLYNAARHSGTKLVEVSLQQIKDQIHLTVRDSGKGFDVAIIASGHGLGLASMRERIRLVHGEIVIQSELALGTCIHAWVPLQANFVNPTFARHWN